MESRYTSAQGVLRVHFTNEDLGRVHVTRTADPLWEMMFSRVRLRETRRAADRDSWSRWVRHEVDLDAIRPGLRVLTALGPLGPYFPDFVTPVEGTHGLLPAIEAIRATPPSRLRHELRLLSAVRRPPGWVRSLAEGDQELLADLGRSLIGYHRTAIEPYTDTIEAAVEADRGYRVRALLDGGVDGLLRSMRPLMQWRPPVLDVRYPFHRDLPLRGRGLRLVPSYFCRGNPVAFADPELPPTLVYPVRATDHEPDPALKALLGATRCAVLTAIGDGATTTELAHRLRSTPSTVSRHTTVLRRAGIITTQRHGPSVLHTLTPLGTALVSRPTGREEQTR